MPFGSRYDMFIIPCITNGECFFPGDCWFEIWKVLTDILAAVEASYYFYGSSVVRWLILRGQWSGVLSALHQVH